MFMHTIFCTCAERGILCAAAHGKLPLFAVFFALLQHNISRIALTHNAIMVFQNNTDYEMQLLHTHNGIRLTKPTQATIMR